MASNYGKVDYDSLSDDNWIEKLPDDDMRYASGAQFASDCDDCFSLCAVGHHSQYDNHTLYQDLNHRKQHSKSEHVKLKSDDDDDGDDEADDVDDAHLCHWREAGKALKTCLSETSEHSLLFGNDDALVTGANIDCHEEPADRSVSGAIARCSTIDDSDLCMNDCQSLPVNAARSSSLPANDLLLLDDDCQASFYPLFQDLRQKISCLDDGQQQQHHPTSWQRRSKGLGELSKLTTWSECSSSDESDGGWFHAGAGCRHRHCFANRRLRSYERRMDNWWARRYSEDPDCCGTQKSSLSCRSSSSRRRQKKSTAEKCSLLSEAASPPEAKENRIGHQRVMSFTDCLADVESNTTDSDSVGHVSNGDDDQDINCANAMVNDDVLSSMMAPVACSFRCIPPADRQTTELTASSIDNSLVTSPVCDKYDHSSSSEVVLSAGLGIDHLSDNDSCPSLHSFGGTDKEDDTGMNEIGSDSDTELTSAAMSTAAVSAAAAAAAATGDDANGWPMCDVETRIMPPEWYDYRNGEVSSLDDCIDDDGDVDNLHLMDSDADDEFECDCPVCQIHQQRISESWQDRERLLPTSAEGGIVSYMPAGMEDNDFDDMVSFTFTAPDYNHALNESFSVDSIFEDVVMQMLQYYPNLLTSQPPPPLTDADFSRLPSVMVSCDALGEETSCSICLCQFEDSEEAKLLPCQHMFHTLCIRTWLNKAGTCPVCRQTVVMSDSAADLTSRHDNDDNSDDLIQHL